MSEQHTERDASAAGDTVPAAERAAAAICDTAYRIGAGTSELGSQIYEQGVRSARNVSRSVEAQPLVAVAIAGALGFLLGYFLGRTA